MDAVSAAVRVAFYLYLCMSPQDALGGEYEDFEGSKAQPSLGAGACVRFTVAYAGGFNLAGLLGVALMQMLMLFDSARAAELPFSCLKNANLQRQPS